MNLSCLSTQVTHELCNRQLRLCDNADMTMRTFAYLQRGKQNTFFNFPSQPRRVPPSPTTIFFLDTCGHNCHASPPHRCNLGHNMPTSPRIAFWTSRLWHVAILLEQFSQLVRSLLGAWCFDPAHDLLVLTSHCLPLLDGHGTFQNQAPFVQLLKPCLASFMHLRGHVRLLLRDGDAGNVLGCVGVVHKSLHGCLERSLPHGRCDDVPALQALATHTPRHSTPISAMHHISHSCATNTDVRMATWCSNRCTHSRWAAHMPLAMSKAVSQNASGRAWLNCAFSALGVALLATTPQCQTLRTALIVTPPHTSCTALSDKTLITTGGDSTKCGWFTSFTDLGAKQAATGPVAGHSLPANRARSALRTTARYIHV